MALIKCPECGKEINEAEKMCPECGCPITGKLSDSNLKEDKPLIKSLKLMRNIFVIASVICFIVSGIFFSKGNNVKNDYYNSEDYPILNKNAYVGGDAYNYIINGTYFTGYVVIASATLLGGIILITNSAFIIIKIEEYEQENEKYGFN